MKVLVTATWTLGLLVVCSAHLCLIEPRQRGTMDGINTPGAPDCLLLQAPCGGRTAAAHGHPLITWGSSYEVIFLKNLNHWTKEHPGYFDLNLIGDTAADITHLGRVKDMGEPSGHLYTFTGTLPHKVGNGDYTLQVEYVTNNVNAPSSFYQCADVAVHT